MMKYILQRLLLFIPTLFVVSLLAFYISVKSPGDPVEILTGSGGQQGGASNQSVSEAMKDSVRARLGLDKPLFYFSLTTQSACDTLYRIPSKKHRASLEKLSHRYGNWTAVSAWYHSLQDFAQFLALQNPDSLYARSMVKKDTAMVESISLNALNETMIQATNMVLTLMESTDPQVMEMKLDSLPKLFAGIPVLQEGTKHVALLQQKYKDLDLQASPMNTWIPAIHVYGFDNQYHRWLMALLQGDFGISYYDKKPIAEKIWEKFFISFKLIFFSVLLAYLISIPIGVMSARRKGSMLERSTSLVLFMLYSLPSFFVGMLLLMVFANPDMLVWFPESGYMDPMHYDPNWNFLRRWSAEMPYMVLPLITYTYSSIAFISRIMRTGMLENLSSDFIRTARAKGLPERTVIWKHAFRNSLLPVITIFVNIFPMAIGGSVIIETIFTYPGMGLASYEAIQNYDYPAIVAIFTLSGFLTMVGYLVADILYAIVDPRITYSAK
jgi:peptide/nickel transport system permease protein